MVRRLPLKHPLRWAVAATVAAVIVSSFAAQSTLAELLSHFVMHYIVALITLALLCGLRREWGVMVIALATLLLCIPRVTPLMVRPETELGPVTEKVTIVQYNVFYRNTDISRVSDWLIELLNKPEPPDVVILQEVMPDFIPKLRPAIQRFPYRVMTDQTYRHGTIILSRLKMEYRRQRFQKSSNYYTVARFETPNMQNKFTIVAAHATSPLYDPVQRNKELQELALVARASQQERKMIIGDLNTTPYSPWFKRLEAISGLKSSYRGMTLQGSWPFFFPGHLRIAIDQLLTSPKVKTVKKEFGPNLGSDHLPIITKVRM